MDKKTPSSQPRSSETSKHRSFKSAASGVVAANRLSQSGRKPRSSKEGGERKVRKSAQAGKKGGSDDKMFKVKKPK